MPHGQLARGHDGDSSLGGRPSRGRRVPLRFYIRPARGGGREGRPAYPRPATDEALALSQSLTDESEVKAQYLVINQAMQQDAPVISGWVIGKLGVVSNRLTGADPDVFGTFINVHQWDVQ